MLSRLFWLIRYSMLIPIIGSWIAAMTALLIGGFEVVTTIIAVTTGLNQLDDKASKLIILDVIESVELFLLGTALYLISLGLYELFIDEKVPVPAWLEIHSLDDLKDNLVKVLVVMLGVQFLAQVLNWNGQVELLALGLSIALVTAALTYFLAQKSKKISG